MAVDDRSDQTPTWPRTHSAAGYLSTDLFDGEAKRRVRRRDDGRARTPGRVRCNLSGGVRDVAAEALEIREYGFGI